MSSPSPMDGASRLPAAVLWDMDGTLLDSEKLWSIALEERAQELGGQLSAETRAAMVGSNLTRSMGLLLADLGLPVTPEATEANAAWVIDRMRELFRTRLLWRPGAEDALAAVHASGVPMGLVTSTVRTVAEVPLEGIGWHHFKAVVFGDEVTHNKPHPDPYLRAARLLGVDPVETVAVEDSPTGVASAVAAGCTVLVVPCEVDVEPGERRVHRASLEGVDVEVLADVLAGQG